MELSDGIALAAVAISLIGVIVERRARKAEVEQERADRREQFDNERARGEEQLRLMRIQVENELRDREDKRRKEQEAADQAGAIRRTPIRVGGHIVADELRLNADVARRCEEGSHVPSEGQAIRLSDWQGRKAEMAGLRDEDAELWSKLEQTYRALEDTKQRGAYPPRSTDLLALADRLDRAADGE